MVERCDAIAADSIRTRESLRDTEQRITDLALLEKQIDTYRKLKPVYDRYKASKDKEKFLRGFESEVILFEAAVREIKKVGLAKLPSAEKIKAELNELTTRKTALQAELRNIQREEKEYDALRRNASSLLKQPAKKEKIQEMELKQPKATSGILLLDERKRLKLAGYISLVQIAIILNISYNLPYSDTTLAKNEKFYYLS